MRPRRVCRGKGTPRTMRCRAGSRCFNEAPACLPGKRASFRQAYLIPDQPASMRPRRVCRGKGRGFHAGGAMGERFNEAPACLPGKRCRGSGRGASGNGRGFNEAPACLPGKRHHANRDPTRHHHASMRPRRVCRGKGARSATSSGHGAARFNEAPACLPGKTPLRRARAARCRPELQ